MVKRVCCSWILWIFHERGEILGWSTQGKKIIMSKEFIFPIDSCESLIISFFFFDDDNDDERFVESTD